MKHRTLFSFAVAAYLPLAAVVAQPVISTQPRDVTVVEQQTGAFRVWADSSGGNLSYQWILNDTPIEDATSDRYFPPPASAENHGETYRVEVRDDNGTTVSASAQLLVSEYTAGEHLPAPDPYQADFYLDAANGHDTLGDGSIDAPFRTYGRIRSMVRGGDVVVFREGHYNTIEFDRARGTVPNPFDDWVVLMAMPGEDVVLESVFLHGAWETHRPLWNGNFDLFVRFIGFTIADGVNMSNVNFVRVENCLVNRHPPYNETVQDIEKIAVRIRGGRSITVDGCEITDTSHGIGARGNDLVFRGNKIHYIAHDGIRLSGCDVVLVENNLIFNTDDGYTDDESPFPRHADGIQLYMEADGSPIPIENNNNITIRGNRIYHHESMTIMASGWGAHSRNWVIENNVFGPSGGYMLHLKLGVQGFIFRHNTVVNVDGEFYEGRYRTLEVSSYAVALPTYSASSGVEIYNNIFRGPTHGQEWSIASQHADRFENNLYHNRTNTANPNLGDNAIFADSEQFVDPGAYDGVLLPGSRAIGAGSIHDPIPNDIYGRSRGLPPTIGAYEFRGVLAVLNISRVNDLLRIDFASGMPIDSHRLETSVDLQPDSGWSGVEADPVETGPGLFRYEVLFPDDPRRFYRIVGGTD